MSPEKVIKSVFSVKFNEGGEKRGCQKKLVKVGTVVTGYFGLINALYYCSGVRWFFGIKSWQASSDEMPLDSSSRITSRRHVSTNFVVAFYQSKGKILNRDLHCYIRTRYFVTASAMGNWGLPESGNELPNHLALVSW